MYSGNHKFGRGGGHGGGATKRKVFGAPHPQRLSSSSSSGRLSLGGSRNPVPSSAPASAAASSEETFSLVAGNPLSFAAIIRLAPDLVEEIKRVEADGGAAKIKFDSNPNNSSGNVIDVGGKEFRFTWSRETGDLCDIYEERQSDEDGNGLLVESGCAWRKLNVQRVLDESAKNHVKRLSEEAERQFKSRKAKFLDPSNASMKSQMKALAAAEASPWKFKHKKDYFKKRSFEPPQVGGPPKAAYKSGLPTTGAAKGRHSASPLPSPQNQSVSLASPSMKGNATENQAIIDDTTHIQSRKKENTLGVEKDLTSRSCDGVQESVACRDNQVEGAKDVKNLLITLLKENPKGMNMKTLEKAVADRTSNSSRKIEPLLEKIATFRPPGIYVLKTAVELGSQKRSSSDSGSSPEDSQQKHYIPEDNLESASASVSAIKSPPEDLEGRGTMDELNLVEKIDPAQHFSDLFGDDEPPDNSEGQAASSRDSGSDSDSDSGSDSGSQSRSRSPAETANGSGSDSENDSASNSKDGSDVEIDILNDDDNEPKKFHDAEQGLSRATVPWNMPDAEPLQDGNPRDQEGFASEDIDIDKDFLGDNEAELASVSRAPDAPTEKLKAVSPDHRQSRVHGVTDMRNEPEDFEEEFKHEQPDSLMRFKGKSKTGFDASQFEENSEHFKRLKSGSMAQSSMSGYMGGISPRSSPDITNEYHQANHNLQVSESYARNDNSNLGGQRGYNHPFPGKFSPDLLQSGQRPHIRSHDIETDDKFGKIPRGLGLDVKHQEANAYKCEGFPKEGDKGRKGTRDDESTLNEKINGKFKGGTFDQKLDMRAEPHYEKHGEEGKKSLTMGNSSRLQLGSSPKDGGQAGFDRASVDKKRLQRELSDLELGELREPLPEEPEVTKKQFDRMGSFKQSDTKSSTSGSQNADLRGRPVGKPTVDTASPSLPTSRAGGLKNMNNWSKRSPEPSAEDIGRPSHQTAHSQQQQSKFTHTDVGYVLSKAADVNRLRPNEGAVNEGTDVEGYGESQKKSNASAQLEESVQDPDSRKVKGNKSLKSNALMDASDRRKDASSTEGRNDKRKRSGSSLDEDVSYSKYEKEEPELKGPIKNFSQYREYVQDYCEKYESYCSLNTILESYRNEFQKLGMDLESAKDRDMERYYNILAQLRESYRRCGMRHKRLKKIFIVLHEELKHLKQRIKEFAVEYIRD